MNIETEDENEAGVVMLVQQYASKFGITFSSKLMDDPEARKKLMQLMAEAIMGKRGAVTDEDVL
ncbi:MAG: hypothetical protein CVU35_06855 [Betaproteobacteria bacterium HGW-Betaproteobacteria-8]|nr:MAG: hypothetical protein CVU35_06855 [Betaproteobacteria bacterium HGW-Betaproteobacteria-8]